MSSSVSPATPIDTSKGFDPLRADVLDDPFPWYRWLRSGPRAYHVEAGDYYAVTRYDDVVEVTREHSTFSSTGGVGLVWASHPMMSMYDPPEHSRLRRIVARAFTPKTVQSLHSTMVEETTRLFQTVAALPSFDFVTDFSEPLVAAVIGDLLGLPREFVPQFRAWSLAITGMLAGNLSADQGEDQRRSLVRAIRSIQGKQDGLLGVLSDANAAARLTENELTAFCVLLLVAGFETTVNGLANGADVLLRHPHEYATLKQAPAGIEACIEETLRIDPPVHAFFRNTLRPWTFGDGSTIPEGKKVMVLFGSANHDESHFADPERFDPRRTPLDHVAFGNGVHYCLGAPLARSLYKVVLEVFLAQDQCLRVIDEGQRTRNSMLRGYHSMKVSLRA